MELNNLLFQEEFVPVPKGIPVVTLMIDYLDDSSFPTMIAISST